MEDGRTDIKGRSCDVRVGRGEQRKDHEVAASVHSCVGSEIELCDLRRIALLGKFSNLDQPYIVAKLSSPLPSRIMLHHTATVAPLRPRGEKSGRSPFVSTAASFELRLARDPPPPLDASEQRRRLAR